MGKTTPWTDDQVAELLRRAKDGEAASAIARQLGKSRNAVLGKLHRMEHAGVKIERRGAILKQGSSPAKGVAARPAPSLQSVALSGVPAVRRGRPFNPRGVAPALPAPVEPVPFVNGERVTLLQLSSSTCKWPLGDPRTRTSVSAGMRHGRILPTANITRGLPTSRRKTARKLPCCRPSPCLHSTGFQND